MVSAKTMLVDRHRSNNRLREKTCSIVVCTWFSFWYSVHLKHVSCHFRPQCRALRYTRNCQCVFSQPVLQIGLQRDRRQNNFLAQLLQVKDPSSNSNIQEEFHNKPCWPLWKGRCLRWFMFCLGTLCSIWHIWSCSSNWPPWALGCFSGSALSWLDSLYDEAWLVGFRELSLLVSLEGCFIL